MPDDPIVELTGKLPLGGRYFVHYLSQNASEAIIRGDSLSQNANAALIAGLSVAHGVQAAMGLSSLVKSNTATKYPPIVRGAVAGTYAVVNGLAAYTQTKIAFNVANGTLDINEASRNSWRDNFRVPNRPNLRLFGKSSYSPQQTLLDMAVTSGLNAAFVVTR